MAEKLHIDIETYSSVDIKTAGAYKYCESIDFEILLVAWALNDGPITIVDLTQGEELDVAIIAALRDPLFEKHAHNANFERNAFRAIGIDVPIDQWHCSAIKAGYCGLPLGLAAVSEALKLEEKGKLATGAALIRFFSCPVKPTGKNGNQHRNFPKDNLEKWEEYKRYCINDVEAEREIGERLKMYVIPESERQNYIMDQEINDRGIMIDIDMAKNAILINEQNAKALHQELINITGLKNPNSPAQLQEWLSTAMNKEIKTLAKDAIAKLLKEAAPGRVTEVLNLRKKSAKTSIKKYVSMLKCVCEDGRAYGLLQYYGAMRTGRWAGRLVQLHNLPQNHLVDIDQDRAAIASGDYDLCSMLYEDIATILSQLIRTAFIAKPGCTFPVADFSAIEARVIAWLAGEQWRLDVFNTHGKIYEASAAMMFGVPIEEITKGNPLRAKGKIAELALGYQGSVGALSKMDKDSTLSEVEKKTIVTKWREKNPGICLLWIYVEKAAKQAIKTKKPVKLSRYRGLVFEYDGKVLTIELPSGRKLFYQSPTFTTNKFGQESIKYMGVDQETKKWGWVDSYGGKFVENCLAADTLALTYVGWKKIINVSKIDLLWDGVEWVSHEGLIDKGIKKTVNLNGVRLTPTHKILTTDGWKEASQSRGFNWSSIQQFDGSELSRIEREKIALASEMHLRKHESDTWIGIEKIKNKILWMPQRTSDIRKTHNARLLEASDLRSVERDETKMLEPKAQSVSQLRGPRNNSVRSLVARFQQFQNRYATNLSAGIRYRAFRQQRGLQQTELCLGKQVGSKQQPQNKQENKYSLGGYECEPSFCQNRNRFHNIKLQTVQGGSKRTTILSAGREEPVYDLLNAGKRHRFTVLTENGPLIVHNCVQAIARDLLTSAMQELRKMNLPIVLHVHDEIVCEVPKESGESTLAVMREAMSKEVPWAIGLPLGADGYVTPFYKKD